MTKPSMNFDTSKMDPIYSASVPKRGQTDSESETLNTYQFLFWCLHNYTVSVLLEYVYLSQAK